MGKSDGAVLITGATDGLGLELARAYSKQGRRLILLGRRAMPQGDPLFTKENYLRLDLTQSDCAKKVTDFLKARNIDRLSLCIMNAGTGYYGPASEQSLESIRDIVTVNLLAPMRLTRALLPFVAPGESAVSESGNGNRAGKIAFISSVMSSLPCPLYAVYGATKAGLDGFARNLRVEQKGRARIVLVRPGAIRTDMHRKLGMPLGEIKHDKFPPADQVAPKIIRYLESGGESTVIGAGNKILRFAGTNLRGLFRIILRKKPDAQSPDAPKAESNPYAGNNPVPSCLITGAADGLGLELARKLAKDGFYVVGVDVNPEKAEAAREKVIAEGGRVDFMLADLSKPAGMKKVVQQCASRKRSLGEGFDIVIHNAGISSTGDFAAGDDERHDRVTAVNLTAPMTITSGLLKEGLVRPRASLVFISSLSYFASYPGAAVYGASKDGIAAYARSLELEPEGRHCLTVFPGPLRTAMAREHSPDNSRENTRMHPEQAAELIVKAVRKRKRILVPGGGNKLFAFLGRYFPGLMEGMMKKLFFDKLVGEPRS